MAFQHHRKEQKEVTLTEIRAQTTLPKPKNILNAKDFTIYITPGSPLVTVNACKETPSPLPLATTNLWMKKVEAKTPSYRRFWSYHLQTTFVEPHRLLQEPSGDLAPDLLTLPAPARAGRGGEGTCMSSKLPTRFCGQ